MDVSSFEGSRSDQGDHESLESSIAPPPWEGEVAKATASRDPRRNVPSRSVFVIPCLVVHGLATLFYLPSFGSAPGLGGFGIYFLFTSFPTSILGALLPSLVSRSDMFIVLLAINSVLVAWGFACGLHFFLYKE
jgi:hypothetical protein